MLGLGMSDTDELQETQKIIDNFHNRLCDFAEGHGMIVASESHNSDTMRWYGYKLKIRHDLYDFNLVLDTEQSIISYCTKYEDDFLGIKTATFGGGKRLVIYPSNLTSDYVDMDANTWYFISKNSEIDRFLGYLLECKYHARNFA